MSREDVPRWYLPLAELGLLALALGTAAGANRLFVGWSFLGELALPLTVCWAASIALRRAGAPVWAAGVAQTALAAVVITWRFAPGTSWFGLPTAATGTLLGDEVRRSFADFSELVAPVPVSPGFLVVLTAALWLFGVFADTAAFRYRAPVQAAIPYVAVFVAAGILARESGRVVAALWFVLGASCFAVTQRALQASGRRWIRGEGRRGAGAVLSGGAAVAVVALSVGLVVGPALPGDDEPVLDLRSLGEGDGPRTVVSPFVGVTSLLGERSDEVVFTVAAPTGAYWRLTALERYDAERGIWVSRGSYADAGGELPAPPADDLPGEALPQRYRIEGLGGPWLPAAYDPRRIESDRPVGYDPATASLITRDDGLARGQEYAVGSDLPLLSPADLIGPATGSGLDPTYLEPPPLADPVEATAFRVTARATTPYEAAIALQDWFRTGFGYDETVDYRDAPDPTLAFLTARRGFCQQFASTFALMARSLGLPARVAVGFTPGEATVLGADGEAPTPGFVVRGRHAHAWPEVHFDGVGWVPFEPTPGRGNPQATQYTGVAPAQAEAEPGATTTSTTTTTPTTTAVAPTAPTDEARLDTITPDTPTAGAAGGAPEWWPLVAAAILAAAAPAARVLWRRRAQVRRRRDPAGGRVAVAYAEALSWASLVGVRAAPEETPAEVLGRLATALGTDGPDPSLLADLAAAETARRFAAAPPDEGSVATAERAAAEVADAVRVRVRRRDRARRLLV